MNNFVEHRYVKIDGKLFLQEIYSWPAHWSAKTKRQALGYYLALAWDVPHKELNKLNDIDIDNFVLEFEYVNKEDYYGH